jgi:hypothetical protein
VTEYVDTTELARLAVDLGNYAAAAGPEIVQALEFNSRLVKDAWRGKVQGNDYAPLAPFSIDYERKGFASAAGSDIEFEIGARKGIGKQGGVVLLLEYGAPRKALGARGFGVAALQENVDDLEQGIAKALDTAARRVNL